jgi:hypothetical protein
MTTDIIIAIIFIAVVIGLVVWDMHSERKK